MSDSQFLKMMKCRDMHEIVDEEWLKDCLSDDDIELPPGEDLSGEEAELDSGDVLEAVAQEEDRWTDLALDEIFGYPPLR